MGSFSGGKSVGACNWQPTLSPHLPRVLMTWCGMDQTGITLLDVLLKYLSDKVFGVVWVECRNTLRGREVWGFHDGEDNDVLRTRR